MGGTPYWPSPVKECICPEPHTTEMTHLDQCPFGQALRRSQKRLPTDEELEGLRADTLDTARDLDGGRREELLGIIAIAVMTAPLWGYSGAWWLHLVWRFMEAGW